MFENTVEIGGSQSITNQTQDTAYELSTFHGSWIRYLHSFLSVAERVHTIKQGPPGFLE